MDEGRCDGVMLDGVVVVLRWSSARHDGSVATDEARMSCSVVFVDRVLLMMLVIMMRNRGGQAEKHSCDDEKMMHIDAMFVCQMDFYGDLLWRFFSRCDKGG